MSFKGDARSEAPSSEAARLQRLLSACDRFTGLGVAGFVWLHLAFQALRAWREDALSEAGFELQPAFVLGLLLIIGPPFAVFSWRELRRGASTRNAGAVNERTRALAVLERLTLWLVLPFTALHLTQIVWPLLSGARAPSDVRPELIAALSGTEHGVPVLAAGYVCGVGAAAFFGARMALRAVGTSRALSRAVVALGALGYVLGSYAVIRCAGGALLP